MTIMKTGGTTYNAHDANDLNPNAGCSDIEPEFLTEIWQI